MGEIFKHVPQGYLITIGATTLVAAGLTSQIRGGDTPSPIPTTDTSHTRSMTVDPACAQHNPYQIPFITGSHPDITINIPPGIVDTSEGATVLFTETNSGHRVIGDISIPPGEEAPQTTFHEYIRGNRPTGYIPGPNGSDITLNGQQIRADVLTGVITTPDEITETTPVQATIVFPAPECEQGAP